MAMTWSGRRQSLYTGFAAIIAVILLFILWQVFFTSPVSCTNGKQDGTEIGVDCGGLCALLCQSQAHPPTVSWARSFESNPGVYTAVAYVQNSNVGAISRRVAYSFQLFDDQNLLVVERDGVVDLPPVQTIPIVETNINVGNRIVARTLFAFSSTEPIVWQKMKQGSYPTLGISQQTHADDYSRLSAMLSNTGLSDAKGVAVIATLFDSNGVARAASKSLLGTVPAKSQQQVVFTWPTGFTDIVRSEITVLPAL